MIEASLLPAEAMRMPRRYRDGMVIRQESPDCLVLRPTSRVCLREIPWLLLGGCFMVTLGLVCLVPVYLITLLFKKDPSCAGRSWEAWCIEVVLAVAFQSGIWWLVMEAFLGRTARQQGQKRSRWDRIGTIVVGVLVPVACLLLFAWRWDQSSLAMRLLGLPLCTIYGLFALVSGTCFLSALVLPVAEMLLPCRFHFNRRGGRVFLTSGLDFPKTLCALEKLAAVQVVGSSEPGFQVNLALSDPDMPRLGVAEYRVQPLAREVGRSLAAFLGVPLVEHVEQEEGAGQ